ALDRGAGRLDKAAWGFLTGAVAKLETRLTPKPAPQPAPAQEPARKTSRSERVKATLETPQQKLLTALRREFRLLCPVKPRGAWLPYVEELSMTRSFLASMGPVAEWLEGRLALNVHHPAVSYAIRHHQDDPGCLVLLVVHLFCLVNERLVEITDAHERSFLESLAESLEASYGETP
ncbi:MAG: hypothetical protein AB1758_37045, partial [Candidatus Eremiobacterota bacterium]